ncbi:protein shisa-5 isoform X2 [Petaurus breviceps papuanus]|uniref:protein shisa-5 isoform X2 n=1 Tax=Petaurus breviceps papuanus TaxID=3040969 RepID=UPI0036DC7996
MLMPQKGYPEVTRGGGHPHPKGFPAGIFIIKVLKKREKFLTFRNQAKGERCGFFESCPEFCCGNCIFKYCCSDVLKKLDDSSILCSGDRSIEWEEKDEKMTFDFDNSPPPGFGTFVGIGATIFVLIVVTIILCLTCSCCCLYKMCRRPRPVVTTSTTVVHSAYPQSQGVPPGYPGPMYQGYQPMPVQPGMPVAPYPTQYPPPYPAQPTGPPAYHETQSGAGAPYPISQPPYNPAYVEPPKTAY